MSAFGRIAELRPVDGVLAFRILRDLTMADLFANDREAALTSLAPAHTKQTPPIIIADGDRYRVKQLTVFEMNSIWQ